VAAAAHCCSQKAQSSPSRYFRSVLCLRSTGPGESQGRAAKSPPPIPCRAAPPRHPEARSATSLARAASPRSPEAPAQRHPPCVFRSPTHFSACCSRHTGASPAFVWWVCRPLELFSAMAHSISSIMGLLSVFTFVSAMSRPVLFNALGIALAA
jgi:hypothetical protein